MFATHKEAREAGWFSRRHQSREAHDAARERYQFNRGAFARRHRAADRREEGSLRNLTPEQRLLWALFTDKEV